MSREQGCPLHGAQPLQGPQHPLGVQGKQGKSFGDEALKQQLLAGDDLPVGVPAAMLAGALFS